MWIIVNIISALGLWGLYEVWLPTLSLAHLDGAVYFAICAVVVTFNICIWFWDSFDEAAMIPVGIVIVACVVILVGGLFVGSAIFTVLTPFFDL